MYGVEDMMKLVKCRASIFFILTYLFSSATAQFYYCPDTGNYTSNSTYKSNLDALLPSLPQSIDDNGFKNATMGQAPETAYAQVLCRGDIELHTCRSCISNASIDIANWCPNHKQAVLWNELCMLRYSNESTSGILATVDQPVYVWSIQNVSSPDQFMEDLSTLLDNLRGQAADGGSMRKVAAGSRATANFQTVFSLLQCTPDLSPEDCSNCLAIAAASIPRFCDRRRGCRALHPSCNIRYEDTPFYNETRLQELQGPITPGKKDASRTRIIIAVVIPAVVCVTLAVFAGMWSIKRTKKQHVEELESTQDIILAEALQYEFDEIKAATQGFSDANKLGEGGFGVVYKGKLSNGHDIAVKRLSMESRQGDVEFKNEVLLVAKLQHRNLVRLLGFSIEGRERLLVYEFVKNASLDRYIFNPTERLNFNSERRYKIILGIARGLLYLHEESRLKIVHRDLKAGNILLDGEMNPKIADFGMARMFAADESHARTNRIMGTYGYMSPEYAMFGHFSVKSDVFSFGVLVLEIVSGQKNISYQNEDDMEDLLNLAWNSWQEGMPENVIDPVLSASSGNLRDMIRCIHIGLLCVQDNPLDRPTMASVVLMLSSSTISLPVPLEPTHSAINPNFQEHGLREVVTNESPSTRKSTRSSKNGMSITEFYPR
ncbi:hypothetical protein F511_15075 [Dorcoceras hygrometricum]|uniref:Cysteine-rich receptor-like protein kinase 29 n=1 Tax=Dorcoceras hygrometricum TaxID=472368 RepID=A0A2Z7BYP9_9LAMI|nr:hypothetical protein F511_15075 [Dorcoceras hygrometricum]